MSDQTRGIVAAIVMVACLALLALMVYLKVDGASLAAVAAVTTLVAFFTQSSGKKDPPSGVVTIAALAVVTVAFMACQVPTPKQQGAIVDASCTLLEAFANSPAEQSICATADDLVALEADMRVARDDASVPDKVAGLTARKVGQCVMVGTLCASQTELAAAIKKRVASKKVGGP